MSKRLGAGVALLGAGLVLSRSGNGNGDGNDDGNGGEEYADEFGNVVNVVDAGADPNGQESIAPVLGDVLDDDTLVRFPPGSYYMDEQVRVTGFDGLGLVGPDASIVPGPYSSFAGPQYRLFRLGTDDDPGNRLVIDGLTIDQGAPETGIRAFDVVVADGLEVRDIDVVGQHDSGTWGPGRFNISNVGGSGIVEGFRAPDGGEWVSETPNAGNLWRGPTGLISNTNRGTLTFRDCEIGAFPDNGLYAASGEGEVRVEGGSFANSGAVSLRVGGAENVVTGASVAIDDHPDPWERQVGVRCDHGNTIIEDVDISISAGTPRHPAALSTQNEAGSVTIRDSSISCDLDGVASLVTVSSGTGAVVVENCSIIHNSTGGYSLLFEGGSPATVTDTVITGDTPGSLPCIRVDRPQSIFERVEVTQRGANRSAIVIAADGCEIRNGVYESTDEPIVDAGSGTIIEDVSTRVI